MRTPESLRAILSQHPRVVLAHTPTPLEDMPRLSAHLGGPRLLVKRDDCTGLATGGNKARPLEWYFGAAEAAGADTMVITGAVQSNYVRTCAAAAAKLGMDCHIQLEERVADMGNTYYRSGNVLLDRLFGATLHCFPVGEDEGAADRSLLEIADSLKAEGKKPFVVKLSDDATPLGTMGYMMAMLEMLDQLESRGDRLDAMVVASGSATTHVGTLLGLRLAGSDIPVHGMCVRRDAAKQLARVTKVTGLACEMLGVESPLKDGDIQVHDDWYGPSYGKMNETTREALALAGQMEGLIVDPTYTAKSFAGLVGLVRAGAFPKDGTVGWIHTGGTPGLFAYMEPVHDALDAREAAAAE